MSLKILKVIGNSMHPTLESGAFVLLWQSPTLYQASQDKGCLYHYISNLVNNLSAYQPSAKPLRRTNYGSTPIQLNINRIGQLIGVNHLATGDIVAVNHPSYGQIIKRINKLRYREYNATNLAKTNQHTLDIMSLRLAGDNLQASISEADIGWVDCRHILGVVIAVVNH